MAMEGVSKGRLIGAIIGFVMAFIGTALLWNVFDKDVPNLNDDQKGSINFYIFAVWIMAAACIFAVIKAESFHVHNAVVIFAFTMFASFFVAVPSPPDARISLSFATLTAVRLTLLAVPVADVCLCVRARMCVCVYVYKQTRLTIVTLSRPPPPQYTHLSSVTALTMAIRFASCLAVAFWQTLACCCACCAQPCARTLATPARLSS